MRGRHCYRLLFMSLLCSPCSELLLHVMGPQSLLDGWLACLLPRGSRARQCHQPAVGQSWFRFQPCPDLVQMFCLAPPRLSFLSQDRKRLPAGSASEQQSLLLSAARPAWNLGQGRGGNDVMCENWTRECWRTGGFCTV